MHESEEDDFYIHLINMDTENFVKTMNSNGTSIAYKVTGA